MKKGNDKVFKRIVALTLMILMVATNFSVIAQADKLVFYENETKVYFNDEFVDVFDSTDATPIVRDGIFYVPIRLFVETKNGSIVWKSDGNKIEADFALGSYYKIKQDSNEIVEYDGENQSLSADVFLYENYDRLMVPSDTFEKLGYKVVLGEDYLGVFSVSENEDVISTSFDDPDSSLIQATVKYSMLNDEGYAIINNLSNTGNVMNEAVGCIGSAVDITAMSGSVNNAEISFAYDDEKLDGVDENDLKIVWYNELTDTIELLESSTVDTENNVVSVKTSHFSEYSVVDSKEWYEAWSKTQLITRGSNGRYHVNLILDTSGSMGDSINLLKETVIQFIDGLKDDDIINLITFSSGTEKVIDEQYKSESNYENVVNDLSANGGTDMLAGLEAADSVMVSYVDLENLTEEEKEHNKKADDIFYANDITILLSDGQPDSDNSRDDIIEKCQRLAMGGKFISLALGSGADTELMKKIAEETSHFYRYIENADELSEMFESISGETIGVDSADDSDGDGIPDAIEKSGMRIATGDTIYTDPNNWDTDGDYISDGEEMGVYDNEAGCFRNESDPSIYTIFQSIASVLEPSIYNVFVDYEGNIQFDLSFRALEKEIVEEYSINATGSSVENSAKEYLYLDIQNAQCEISPVDDCLTLASDSGTPHSEEYHYWQQAIKAKCKNGVNCTNEHKLKITISGSNLDPVAFEVALDYRSALQKQLQQDINKIQNAVSDQAASKVYNKYTESEKIADDISERINVTGRTSDADMEQAIRIGIMDAIAEESVDSLSSSNPTQFVKDCYSLMRSDSRKLQQKYNGKEYNISWNGFVPKVNNVSSVFLNVECYESGKEDGKKTYVVTMEPDEEFIEAFELLLDNLNEKTAQSAGKTAIKAIIKEWGISGIIDNLTTAIADELGIREEVMVYNYGKGININENAAFVDITGYTKLTRELNLGDEMINALIDSVADVANAMTSD